MPGDILNSLKVDLFKNLVKLQLIAGGDCPLNQLYCCIRKLQTREFFPVIFEFGNYLFICYPKICIRQNTDHRE